MRYTVTVEPFYVEASGATESEAHANAMYLAWDKIRNGQYTLAVVAMDEIEGAAI